MYTKPSKLALQKSRARLFVGQLEPYVMEDDLFPVFSCYGHVLHINVVRHSTTVTPHEERRIPTAFVWYATTAEADAAIAALHNNFSFSLLDEEESKRRYIQVSYADKTPECTNFGVWQKHHAEASRRTAAHREAVATNTIANVSPISSQKTVVSLAELGEGLRTNTTENDGNIKEVLFSH